MKSPRSKLSLHIRHPDRDLSIVCESLNLAPKNLWKKGDERRTPKGHKLTGIRDNSFCTVEMEATNLPLQDQIERALNLLAPHRSIFREISSNGGQTSFYVGCFLDEDSVENFEWRVLESMADLRISLELNIYLPDQLESHTFDELPLL